MPIVVRYIHPKPRQAAASFLNNKKYKPHNQTGKTGRKNSIWSLKKPPKDTCANCVVANSPICRNTGKWCFACQTILGEKINNASPAAL